VNFLKNLFSTNPTGTNPSQRFYVRPKRCDEIVEIRIDLYNEPSLTDEGQYFVRKIVRGKRCPFPAELLVYLDKGRNVKSVEVVDGEQVSFLDYTEWLESKQTKSSG
jgi:hypothetical protein